MRRDLEDADESLLQTLVLPLLFLWLMVALGRRLITGGMVFNNQRKA